jgi:hypothetical protein
LEIAGLSFFLATNGILNATLATTREINVFGLRWAKAEQNFQTFTTLHLNIKPMLAIAGGKAEVDMARVEVVRKFATGAGKPCIGITKFSQFTLATLHWS